MSNRVLTEKEVLEIVVSNKLFVKIANTYVPTKSFNEFLSNKDSIETKEPEVVPEPVDKVVIDKPKVIPNVIPKSNNDSDGFTNSAWIKYWNELFPTSSNNPHKRNLRSGFSGKYGVLNKMLKFITESKYSKELIVLSTIFYLGRELKKDKFKYTKESGNFISKKDEPSKLEAECVETLEILNKKGLQISDLRLVEYVNKEGNTSIKITYNSDKVGKPEVQDKVQTTINVSNSKEEFTSVTNVSDKMNGENMFEDDLNW